MATYAPYHVDIAPWMDWKSSSNYNAITRVNDTSSLGMARQTNTSSAASQHVEWDVAIDAGTWTLTLIYTKATSAGILTPSLDGSDLSTLDMYNSSTTVNNVNQWTGISVGSAGIKELKFRTDSKNASATAWHFYCQWITLTRTGA